MSRGLWCATVAGAVLAGCATQEARVWIRADGQRMTGNPTLTQQVQIDKTICQGEVAKTDAASVAPAVRRFQAADDVFEGCMAQRGYMFVPSSEAEARLATAAETRHK